MMLELNDIQHILLARTPALTGEYVFLSFRDATAGRAWLNGILDKVRSAADVQSSIASGRTSTLRSIRRPLMAT